MAFPNYTYPAYGAYNPVTPFAPAPQVYQPQQPTQQPSQTIQPQSNVNTQPAFFCRPVASREEVAISTLSFSELEAIIHIFEELDGTEGILVASKIADRVGITRSVIVNALRKFESAGVIESRS